MGLKEPRRRSPAVPITEYMMRMMTWEKGERQGYSRRMIFKKESKPTSQRPYTYRLLSVLKVEVARVTE